MQKAKSAGAGKRAAAGAPRVALADAVPTRGGLGSKFTCFKCGSKFYDLNRPKALCPKCGADQKDAPKLTAKQRQAPAPKPIPVEPEVERERERDRDRDRDTRRAGPMLDEDDEEIVIDDEPEDLELALEVVEGDDDFTEEPEEEPEEES